MILNQRKIYHHISILLFLLFLLVPSVCSTELPNTWNNEFSFVQQIDLLIDTSNSHAHHQPIDIPIKFSNPCWAKNEDEHSIRVVCQLDKNWYEIESQIYNLESTETNYISKCNLIFLIPEFADGNEAYYVVYDNSEKESPGYTDHVEYQESSYHYEPIPGYPLQSKYYEIIDDGFINYMISYDGEFMGYDTCQHVYKMIDGATEILPKNAELFAAFDYKYCYDDGLFDYSSTSQQLVSKQVVTNGNLMIEIGIISTSKFNDLKTTATYKYYHCPDSNKRIHVNVIHETLEKINVYDLARTDGAFASMQAGGVKSRSINELNIGQILPWMHFKNEFNTVSEYPLDLDPEYIKDDPDIRVISIYDDVDLNQHPWITFDRGETGKTHALIFDSNSIVQSGTQENDGIQINAFQMDYPHLSGLENNIATVQAGRNSIEPDQSHDLTIPEDFVVEFDAAFFSSNSAGYPIAEEETSIFQNLVKMKPSNSNDYDIDSNDKEVYDLSAIVHHAPSIPMGSSLSAALGFNLSYITVELYENNTFLSSQNAVRVSLNMMEEFEDSTFFSKIMSYYNILDLSNFSFFKKVVFSDIERGTYVLKVYRENPLRSDQRQYIGYSIIELTEDTSKRILCRQESSLTLSILDQDKEPVKDADVRIQTNGQTISSTKSDASGKAIIMAPSRSKNYILQIRYNSDTLIEESVKLNYFRSFTSRDKTILIERYALRVQILDTWNQPLGFNSKPVLNIKDSPLSSTILGETKKNEYLFTNLTPNTYILSLKYKNFFLNETIEITKETESTIDFPAEFEITFTIFDKRGSNLKESKILIQRNDIKKEYTVQSGSSIQLPPGQYQIDILKENQIIGSRSIQIFGGKNVDILTIQKPIYPIIIIMATLIFSLISLIFLWLTDRKKIIIILLILSLLITSLVMPWWEITGSTKNVESTTQLFLIPSTMVTLYETENSISGEPSYLPPEFEMALFFIIFLIFSGCSIIALSEYAKEKNLIRKRYQNFLTILPAILLIIGLIGFLIALNELCAISMGSIFGSGIIETGIPGKTGFYSISSIWGPSIGFYLLFVSTILYVISNLYEIILLRKRYD
jgi:hypothetical protein